MRLQGGPTAGQRDTRLRVRLVQLAHTFAAATYGIRGDRAAIKDDHLRLCRLLHRLVADGLQTLGERLHFAIVQATANLIQIDTHDHIIPDCMIFLK